MLSECNILIDVYLGMTGYRDEGEAPPGQKSWVVVIDYLQLMQSDHRIENRVQESPIFAGLKLLARN